MHREAAAELAAPHRLAWPGFVLDLARRELLGAEGRPTELRAQALRVLLVLGEHAGQVVSKELLMQRVWGDLVVTEDSLVQAVGDIRRVLGDGAHQRLRTVPRRGYLLVVPEPVASVAPALAPAVERAVGASAPPSRQRSERPERLWPAAVGALLLVLAIVVAAWAAWPHDAAMPRSLAILPFESDADTEAWFVEGVGGDLTATLSAWSGITVIGRGTMATYRGKGTDPRAVGRELGVRFVLTGRARRDGDRARLAVTLVDASSGQAVWSEMRDVPRAELAALVGDVAGGIARALAVPLGDAVAADARTLRPAQAQADDLAMQANAELLRGVSPENWERARQLAEQAVAIDPASVRGLAMVSLANSNLVLFEWAKDRAATINRAEQALAQLETLVPDYQLAGFARASLAHVRKDWEGVAAIGAKLVEAYPNEPTSHHHRCSALLRLGRFDDAIAACARALRISPRDTRAPVWHGLTGFNHFLLGRHAQAEEHARVAVLGNPRLAFYPLVLAAALAEQGRRDEATKVIAEALARQPSFRQSSVRNYWVAADARFTAGRDRIITLAGELGLPP